MKYQLAIFDFDGMLADSFPFFVGPVHRLAERHCFQGIDLEAACKEGIAFGAVAWGYGAIESFRKHAPEEEFDQVSEIKRIA